MFNIEMSIPRGHPVCSDCGAPMKIIARIEDPIVIGNIVLHVEATSRAPLSAKRAAGARAPPGGLRLTFTVDEDRYYIFFYADPENMKLKEQAKEVEERNTLKKYGKEHFSITVKMVIWKGFNTGNMCSLGLFHDNCALGDEFILAPFLWNDGSPESLNHGKNGLQIRMNKYKWKIPTELNYDDYEYYHWHKIVK